MALASALLQAGGCKHPTCAILPRHGRVGRGREDEGSSGEKESESDHLPSEYMPALMLTTDKRGKVQHSEC
jgi:hypothetical protein